MSWQTGSLMVDGSNIKDGVVALNTLGYKTARRVGATTFDEASSPQLPGKAFAQVGRWNILFDPMMFFDLQEEADPPPAAIWPAQVDRAILRNKWDVVSFLLAGTSSTFGYAHYVQGRRQRSIVFQESEIVHESGEASQEELDALAAFPDDKEKAILDVMRRLVLNLHELEQVTFSLFEVEI